MDIYNIAYITIKKFDDCENIHGVSPLYLIIHSTIEHFKEKKRWKILNSWFDIEMRRSLVRRLDQKLKNVLWKKLCKSWN